MKDFINAEIAKKYREAGYNSTIGMAVADAMARKNELFRLADKQDDQEIRLIAEGAESAYADILEANK